MPQNKEKENLEKMLSIADLIEKGNEELKVGTINYYKDFVFQGSGSFGFPDLSESDLFIAKVENTKENSSTYEIYSGEDNSLIATVDEQGKLHFMPEYIEKVKQRLMQVDERYVDRLNLEDLDFKLPQELEKDDRVLTKQEREHIVSTQRKTGNLAKGKKLSGEESQEEIKDEKQQEEKSPEEQQREEIAKAKKIPSHNVLIVKENSNLYKDHPNLEPNLYFYRDSEGIVRAEYIDENGESQPSQYFEPSTTSLRQETVSLGDDGNPVTREVPYQVMRTKGLNSVDKDIRDIRITVDIDTYGYLEIAEARQGKNGEWLSHDIEVKGRNYNSHAVNETTSIRNRKAEPDKQTEAYEQAADTGLVEDGIQYNEMYLMEHAEELIDCLVKEGYQRHEAVQVFNYVIGEERLTLKEAKERVNKEIEKNAPEQARGESEELAEEIEEDRSEERTPWGDAERRDARRGV